jgi:hypothetical protein
MERCYFIRAGFLPMQPLWLHRQSHPLLNNPAASCRVSELGDEICLKGVASECFYEGSSSEPAWIPA